MDWNALGTWAAVLVALGIALKDTVSRQRERTARHLLVAAEILPEIEMVETALKHAIRETKSALSDAVGGSIAVAFQQLEETIANFSLQPLRGFADQPDALPERMLIPLVKAIKVMQMLNHNSEAQHYRLRQQQSRVLTETEMRALLRERIGQVASAANSLQWVREWSEALLRSRRWTNPESP